MLKKAVFTYLKRTAEEHFKTRRSLENFTHGSGGRVDDEHGTYTIRSKSTNILMETLMEWLKEKHCSYL
jgi:hypothetical protein